MSSTDNTTFDLAPFPELTEQEKFQIWFEYKKYGYTIIDSSENEKAEHN